MANARARSAPRFASSGEERLMAATGPDFQPGDVLPGTKYRVVKQIGAGGMGVVYQVVKAPAIQGVLKLMSSELTEHQEFRTRFFDEVRVLAQLDHPNIVRVFDYDSLDDGTPFYVMELLHGRTVRDVIATMGTVPPRVAFEVTRQLCEALHCAHTHDIPVIHRDIKPENIFLHAPRHGEPVVKLIDFGVVAVADRQHDGTFVGTWKYAAPEQIRGQRAMPATDLYAVGLVLYEMLSGLGPFDHLESDELVSQAHLRELPAPVSKFAPWVPSSIVELIASALSKDPKRRPRNAYAFAERLYELEWASDGKDPDDRSPGGALSRILSTVGGGPVSAHLEDGARARSSGWDGGASAPQTPAPGRASGVDASSFADHDANDDVRGDAGSDTATPGADTLLDGLVARPDLGSGDRSGRRRERRSDSYDAQAAWSARAEQPAPIAPRYARSSPSDAAATRRRSVRPDQAAAGSTIGISASSYDTLATHESDAQVLPRRRAFRASVPLALAAVLLVGIGSFAALRLRSDVDVPQSSSVATSQGALESMTKPDLQTVGPASSAATVLGTPLGASAAPNASSALTTSTAPPATPSAVSTPDGEALATATSPRAPSAASAQKPRHSPTKGRGKAPASPHPPPASSTGAPPVRSTPPVIVPDESFVRGL